MYTNDSWIITTQCHFSCFPVSCSYKYALQPFHKSDRSTDNTKHVQYKRLETHCSHSISVNLRKLNISVWQKLIWGRLNYPKSCFNKFTCRTNSCNLYWVLAFTTYHTWWHFQTMFHYFGTLSHLWLYLVHTHCSHHRQNKLLNQEWYHCSKPLWLCWV